MSGSEIISRTPRYYVEIISRGLRYSIVCILIYVNNAIGVLLVDQTNSWHVIFHEYWRKCTALYYFPWKLTTFDSSWVPDRRRAPHTGRGSDSLVLIEAGGFYPKFYGIRDSTGMAFLLAGKIPVCLNPDCAVSTIAEFFQADWNSL